MMLFQLHFLDPYESSRKTTLVTNHHYFSCCMFWHVSNTNEGSFRLSRNCPCGENRRFNRDMLARLTVRFNRDKIAESDDLCQFFTVYRD